MARVARVAAVLGAAAIAACFSKPGVPHVRDDAGGNGDDGRGPPEAGEPGMEAGMEAGMGAEPMCGADHDNFDLDGSACGSWGTAQISSALSRGPGANDHLRITPPMGSDAHCMTNQSFDYSAGSTINFAQAPTTQGSHSYYRLTTSGGGSVEYDVAVGLGTMVMLSCSGPVTFASQPFTMDYQWARFSPSGTSVLIEHGSDGSNWTQAATCDWGQSTTLVNATIGAASTSPGNTAEFDDFNERPCPP